MLPNVAATLDYFESNGKCYLIEEFIDGQTLWERLEKDFEVLDPHLAAHVFTTCQRELLLHITPEYFIAI